jgi:23S rRNA (adenine2503-C2)-methyltransferase
MPHVLNMTVEQLAADLAELGEKPFRARQIVQWIFVRGAREFAEMTDLPATLRPALAERYSILTGQLVATSTADDGTAKCLLEFPGGGQEDRGQDARDTGGRIETVLIPAAPRATACVSTQIGCPMGCLFCASGLGGVQRDLTAGEIIEQVLQLQHATGLAVTHVVFMGMGEPLANYDATLGAIRGIIDPRRLGISARRVTVSTIGLPEQILRLAGEDLPVTLAISLHATRQALRGKLIPAARAWPLPEVLSAARQYFEITGRRVTLEYVLLAGVNDGNVAARELAEIARSLAAQVNVIRYNPVPELPYRRPSEESVRRFMDQLTGAGANATLRQSRGLSSDAACGQLRRRPGTIT